MREAPGRPYALTLNAGVIMHPSWRLPRNLQIKHLDRYIVESMEREKELRPLLLFRGSMSEHRVRTLFALMRLLRDNDIPSPNQAQQFLSLLPDERHRSGLHAATIDSMSWIRWLCRLSQSPSVFEIDRNLKTYCDWLLAQTSSHSKFLLERISETAFRTRRDWRRVSRPRRIRKEVDGITEFYPYLRERQELKDYLMLSAVHHAVSKSLPEDIRADICQDLIVSILAGEVSVDNCRDKIPEHLRSHRQMYGDRWRTISLETPLGGDDRRTIGDTLRD
jgi:hypothetical protein